MPSDLGHRICIIGPSNSGKSTLAQNLESILDIPAYHLDQMAHKPHSNWERLPDAEFVRQHDDVIARDQWILDGNYSVSMPQRFARANSVIWIDPNLCGCIIRYIFRSLSGQSNRAGGLQGAEKEFGFGLIKYTLFNYPKSRRKYEKLLAEYPHLRVYHFYRMINAERDLV